MTRTLKDRLRRSIPDEAEAIRRHHAFLTHWKEGKDGDPPRPGFRDCPNCPLVASASNDRSRRAICATCPWMDYPTSPSRRFLLAMELANYPEYVLAGAIDELTPREHQSVAALNRWRQDQKDIARMGSFMGVG